MAELNETAKEWLEKELPTGEPVHRRLSYLLVAAGSWEPNGYGFISSHNGHQRGLEQQEFFSFLCDSNFLWGMAAIDNTVMDLFEFYFRQNIKEKGLEDEYDFMAKGEAN